MSERGAAKTRLHRERERRGLKVYRVLVDVNALAGALIDEGRVAPDETCEQAYVQALTAMVEEYSGSESVTGYGRWLKAKGIIGP